ncbi:hypothetical protein C7477_11413 [Phyllobacterium leguminum]|uniref:Uncharacterized protein n=1 Tax=Phyllobacterium leguminum TaxID=314237 RepID=A0A318SYT1_9HYPH|nr:hypothetical protein C7477_11413 [Phyllobacterium leguminum]
MKTDDLSARPQFDTLLNRLRATEEWQYVEREVEIRLRMRDLGTRMGRV